MSTVNFKFCQTCHNSYSAAICPHCNAPNFDAMSEFEKQQILRLDSMVRSLDEIATILAHRLKPQEEF